MSEAGPEGPVRVAVQPSDPLETYTSRMRRQRRWYVAIVAAIVVAAAAFVAVEWAHGEAAHATLHTISHLPAPLALQNPSPDQQVAWRTGDRLAIGAQPYRGTVITYDARTVRGLNARTGRPTWSYTRTDRTVCTAAQLAGTTVAVYELHGNCDELSAFDSNTGKRQWTRTLDIDGQPLNGHPAYQWTPTTLMITSPAVIYAIDPAGGLNRWTYSRFGCVIGRAVLGSAGALISQTCARPQCAKVKFCGPGAQLFLRDPMAGNGDNSSSNPDQIKWLHLRDSDIPASAGTLLSAFDRSGRTLHLLQTSGRSAGSLALSPAPRPPYASETVEADNGEQLVWIGGVTYVIQQGATGLVWSTRTATPPTVVSVTGDDPPRLPAARISVATSTGLAELDGSDGRVVQRFPVPAPGIGLVTPLGTGFLASGTRGVVAYR